LKKTTSVSARPASSPFLNPFKARLLGKTKRAGWTDIELLLGGALRAAGVKFYDHVKIGPYEADFVIPGDGVVGPRVLEADGEHWHKSRKAKDDRRDHYLRACGYQVFRFTGTAIKKNAALCVRTATRPEFPNYPKQEKLL
jgi:very-short-patch-repair endonuclease